MKLSKKEMLLVCYLVFKIAALVAQYLDPTLKSTFDSAISKFVNVLNSEKELVE